MPQWAGKWKGGRYYLDDAGRKVFFIERRVMGKPKSIRLKTSDEDLAKGELARFLADPVEFCRLPAPAAEAPQAVFITKERLTLYMESIHGCVKDHRAARRNYLHDWAEKGLDLRTATIRQLRGALAEWEGGHEGRVESLNAFCNFLVRELRDLPSWSPLISHRKSAETRAPRMAYSIEQLEAAYRKLAEGAELHGKGYRLPGSRDPAIRDAFMLKVSTGMHHTEIQQLYRAPVFDGPLPDKGVGIRILKDEHEIAGVLQFRQKTKPRHRISVNKKILEAALRLRERVPHRGGMYKALEDLGFVPSNLRHTWVTLCGEVGEIVNYKAAGIPLDQIQGIAGHRVGSKVTQSSYDKLQVPPMSKLPIKWG
jgi:hypothetical protein